MRIQADTIQADSAVSGTNGLLISCFSPWRHEERDTILTMLTILSYSFPHAADLVMFKISIHLRRSRPKTLKPRHNDRKLNSLPPRSNLNCLFFKIPKFSGPSLLPALFPVCGLL